MINIRSIAIATATTPKANFLFGFFSGQLSEIDLFFAPAYSKSIGSLYGFIEIPCRCDTALKETAKNRKFKEKTSHKHHSKWDINFVEQRESTQKKSSRKETSLIFAQPILCSTMVNDAPQKTYFIRPFAPSHEQREFYWLVCNCDGSFSFSVKSGNFSMKFI